MAKYERMFEGNVDFNGIEGSYQKEFVEKVAAAGATKEEMIDVLKDLNVVISKSMNDTIDAAKNGAKVYVPFMENIRNTFRSGAVATKDYAEISLIPGQLALAPLKLSVRGTKDEMKSAESRKFCGRPVRVEEREKNQVFIVEDLLTSLRNETATYAYAMLQDHLKAQILTDMKLYRVTDMRLHNSLRYLSQRYVSAMRIKDGDRKSIKRAIVQMSRNLVHNYSSKGACLFQEAYAASCYKDKKTNADRTNSYYMAFTAEAVNYFVTKHCPDKMFENRVYKFGRGKAQIGQKITFVNGISADGFYTETKVNGTYKLEINNKLQAIIRKPVKEMIPVPEYDDTVVFMELQTVDRSGKEFELLEKSRADGSQFTVRYVNYLTGKVQNDFHRADLWLVSGSTKIAKISTPVNNAGIPYYDQFLANQNISVKQLEVLPATNTARARIYMIGHVCGKADPVPVEPTMNNQERMRTSKMNISHLLK